MKNAKQWAIENNGFTMLRNDHSTIEKVESIQQDAITYQQYRIAELELQVQVMRQALQQYNSIVAAMLSLGGTDINAWWDKIITAQQDGAVALSIPPLPSQYIKREVADKLARLLTRQSTGQTLQFADYKEIQEALSLYSQQPK